MCLRDTDGTRSTQRGCAGRRRRLPGGPTHTGAPAAPLWWCCCWWRRINVHRLGRLRWCRCVRDGHHERARMVARRTEGGPLGPLRFHDDPAHGTPRTPTDIHHRRIRVSIILRRRRRRALCISTSTTSSSRRRGRSGSGLAIRLLAFCRTGTRTEGLHINMDIVRVPILILPTHHLRIMQTTRIAQRPRTVRTPPPLGRLADVAGVAFARG